MPVSAAASAPGASTGPSERSALRLRGAMYSVDDFVRPSITRMARGTSTPVR